MTRVVDDATVPVIVNTTELPAPAAMFTVDANAFPAPVAPAVTLAVPVVLEVQATPVIDAGMVSAMVARGYDPDRPPHLSKVTETT